jgi:hypothetical protein
LSKYSSLQLFDQSDDLDDKTAGDWEHLHLDETFHGTFLSPSSYQQQKHEYRGTFVPSLCRSAYACRKEASPHQPLQIVPAL